MPRLQNDTAFDLVELRGKELRQLTGYGRTGDIACLVFDVGESQLHTIFLDAGIGFWERWSSEEIENTWHASRFVDLSSQWNLSSKRIISAACTVPDDEAFSLFRIEFAHGVVCLRYALSLIHI